MRQVAIVTTNDRFIMTAWKKAMRSCMEKEGLSSIDTEVTMLADDKGELIKALGLAYNMAPKKTAAWSFQLNAGLRSKRFALVASDGVVEHIAVDEGDTDLVSTSAESILEVLKPAASPLQKAAADAPKGSSEAALAFAALAALAATYYYTHYV